MQIRDVYPFAVDLTIEEFFLDFQPQLLASYAPALWLVLTSATIWTYWRVRLASLLSMAFGSLILATTTSLVVWFSDASGVPAAGSAAEAGLRVVQINVVSMVGMLLFVAGTVALLRGIGGRRANA